MKRLTKAESNALYDALTSRLIDLADRIERWEKKGYNASVDSEREAHAALLRVLAKAGWRTKPYEL